MKKRTSRTKGKRTQKDTNSTIENGLPSLLPQISELPFTPWFEMSSDDWIVETEKAIDDYWKIVFENHENGKISEDAAEFAYLCLMSAKSSIRVGFVYGLVVELITAGQVSDSASSTMRQKLQAMHDARVAGGKSRTKELSGIKLEVIRLAKLIHPHYLRHRKLGKAYVDAHVPRATFERKLKKIAESKGLDWGQLRENLFLGHFDDLSSESN